MIMLCALLLFALSVHYTNQCSSTINPIPVCSVYTPNSILEHPENFKPHIIDGKKRYSTCTGAAWFHENYLAVLNLYGKKVITYKFSPEEKTFCPIQEITNEGGAQLFHPENVTVSPDGTLLIICSDNPYPGLKIYLIDPATHLINPKPIFSLPASTLVHNVRCTSDGTYIALVGWDTEKSICIYKLLRSTNNCDLELMQSLPNNSTVLKPKGINFTKDNKFAVICYAQRVTTNTNQPTIVRKSVIVSYKFNNDRGRLEETICCKEIVSSAEDIAFLHNDTEVVVTDQANDRLIIYPFDPTTGQMGEPYSLVQNPQAQLSFPHGMGVSANGKYIVVTNYGDDKFNLYQCSG